jgi:hypothetical protein
MPATTHQRAMNILGLNYVEAATIQRSLEIEVENYLNDNNIVTESLVFWQVGTLFWLLSLMTLP